MTEGSTPGLAVFAYRGYDGSGGEPREADLEADAVRVVDHVVTVGATTVSRVALVGYSLGTGVAAAATVTLADRGTPPAALVLLAPYTSIAAIYDLTVPIVPVGWVAPDPYRTDRLAPRLRGIRTLIVHGGADRLIPPEHGRALAAAIGGSATYMEVPDAAHTLCDDPRALRVVSELLRSIP
jgi:uncharacterized protein